MIQVNAKKTYEIFKAILKNLLLLFYVINLTRITFYLVEYS